MPSALLEDLINVDFQAQEPWPQPITLYQPLEVEQILLPDNANCLAVRALLRMCDLDFQINPRSNAEYMSPSGTVPFIKCGASVVPEFDKILAFLEVKGVSLERHRDEKLKPDIRAYMKLVDMIFGNAELYICWVDPTTWETVTKPRNGVVYPWPLNHIMNWQKKREVIKRLKALGWYHKTLEQVCDEVDKCCNALSAKLENKEYFSGEKPGELDALIYGHVNALVNAKLPPSVRRITGIVNRNPILMKHLHKVQSYIDNSFVAVGEDFVFVEDIPKDLLWEDFLQLT